MSESTVIEPYGAIIVQSIPNFGIAGPIVHVQQTHSHQSIVTNVQLYNCKHLLGFSILFYLQSTNVQLNKKQVFYNGLSQRIASEV